jgi:hypothetical protein
VSLFTTFYNRFLTRGLEYFGRYYSFYDGVCVDNKDPDEQGKIRVLVPQVGGNKPLGRWAWPRPPWGGRNSGFLVVPDINDPVEVVFRNGDPSYPKYSGGSWPNVKGNDNFTPTGAYVDGEPLVRIFRTKSGHELSFSDDPDNLGCKFIWHDPENDKYTYVVFTKDGNIQMATHKGSVFEMRATDDDGDLNMMLDSRGNSIIQDVDGIKIIDASGNVFELKSDTVQILGTKDVVVNSQAINLKTGSVVGGDGAAEHAVRGTTWFQWFMTKFLPHYLSHIHPTGVGPSSALTNVPPLENPVQTDVLTDKFLVP